MLPPTGRCESERSASVTAADRIRRPPRGNPWEDLMLKSKLTRRRLLSTAAASVIAMPYVRGAHAAGKLSFGCCDHCVPGANTASQKLCEEVAAKGKYGRAIAY